MSAVISPLRENNAAVAVNVSAAPTEHLHLHMVRTHWATYRHENLGIHLQDALSALDLEGWEVVAAYVVGQTPEVILRRVHRALDA